MPVIKEPQYFASDVLGEMRQVRTMGEYLRCFGPALQHQIAGEASVAYLGSPGALKAIREFQPSARIIVMLRNPIDVMYSEHHQRIYDTREPSRDFETALDAEDRGELPKWRRREGLTLGLGLRETVKFADQLLRCFQIFGRERVHVILYDDLVADTEAIYGGVLGFLNIAPDCTLEFKIVNANKRVRLRSLHRLVIQPPPIFRRVARAVLPEQARRAVGEGILRINSSLEPRIPLRPELKRRLQEQFTPEVKALGMLLNRDLSGWIEV
jgi:hypothetical protein